MARAPLAALQAFVLAAQYGNLSRAAERLNLTVSALSHQIRGLEERLGQRLFLRGPRGVALTPDGERLLDAVASPLETIERALAPVRASSDNALSLSMIMTFASGWLVPRLPRFVERHPDLELQLHSSATLVDFSREPIDAALRFGPGQWPGLNAVHLFDEWIAPVASPDFVERHGLALPVEADMSKLPLLGDPGERWKDWFDLYGGRPPKRYVAQFGDSETLHRAAVEGLGIALGRMVMARPLIHAGRLVVLVPERLRSEWSYYLVYPPRSARHAGVAAFREWVLEEAAVYQAGSVVDAQQQRRPRR